VTTLIDRTLLDSLTAEAERAPRRRKSRNFHPGDAYPAHRLLVAMEPESYVAPHRHLDPDKDETLIVVRGCLGVVIFRAENAVDRSILLQAGGEAIGIDIPHGVLHTVVALAAGTVFFEAKAGPYVPIAEAERAPWAPAEGTPEAVDYQEELRALFA
jgi:cupin fold WbuC family metalloprotein